jgi:hypothetical protein
VRARATVVGDLDPEAVIAVEPVCHPVLALGVLETDLDVGAVAPRLQT